MSVAAFLLILGASARLTRLVTRDELLDPLRDRIRNDRLAYWLGCPYCVGFWISCLVVVAWWFAPWPGFAAFAAALTVNLIWATFMDVSETWESLYQERTNINRPRMRPRSQYGPTE